MRVKSRLIIILSLLLISAASYMAQNIVPDENLLTPVNRLKFGNYLFHTRDYLRAIDEYKSYLKTANNDTVKFNFAESFFELGRYTEAEDNFKTLFFNSPLSDEARLGFYKSDFFRNDFQSFRNLTENKIYMPEKYSGDVKRLVQISYLFDSVSLPDTAEYRNAFPDSAQPSMMNFYMRKKYPDYKSPAKASWLSAIVPGLGKIYTGEISDGITGFIATGLMIFLTVDNFKAHHNFRGAVFGVLSAISYAGGIYGAAASAHIYNAGISFNFDKDLRLYLDSQNYFLPDFNFADKSR